MLLRWLAVCLVNYCSIASSYSSSHITQVLLSKCSGSNRYTTTCFKLDFLRLMSLLGENTRVPLGPGVALVGTDKTRNVAEELDHGLVSPRSRDQLDNFIMAVAEKYLGSLNLTVQLNDARVVQGARSMVTDVFEVLAVAGYAILKSLFSFIAVWYYEWVMRQWEAMGEIVRTNSNPPKWTDDDFVTPSGSRSKIQGRLKKTRWAFLWTILAILFAVMAGLSGSALMASMIALILSAVVVLRAALGGGAGFGAPPSGFGYALPVGHTTASGRITAYDLNPEVYMDDNSHSASSNTPIAYAAYARQSFPPVNGSKPLRPTKK